MTRFLTIFIGALILILSEVQAQWSSDPSQNLEISSWGSKPQASPDTTGGAYILWHGSSHYVQHVNRSGIISWVEPVEIRGEWLGLRSFPSLAPDELGGILVSFTEEKPEGSPPYQSRARVNRIDGNGNLLWGEFGVIVSLNERHHSSVTQVVADMEGGAYVSFGTVSDSLVVQRISSAGERLWGDEGILVTDTSGSNFSHSLVTDGLGGVIIHWLGWDTGFKRYDSDGTLVWQYPMPDATHYNSHIMSDRSGGVYLAGAYYVGGNRDIVANKISSTGDPLWGESGVVVDEDIGLTSSLSGISKRTDSSLILTWTRVVDPVDSFNVFAQVINLDGEQIYSEAIALNRTQHLSSGSSIISANDNTAIFAWSEYDSDQGSNTLVAQKLDEFAGFLWGSDDAIVSDRPYSQKVLMPDRFGGAIAIWDEQGGGIYGQQFSTNGILGEIIDGPTAIDYDEEHDFGGYVVHQNYPNPFNPSTKIRWIVPFSAQIKIVVYDLLGREIATLFNEYSKAGEYSINWNGRDRHGIRCGSGIYYYRTTASVKGSNKAAFVSTQKMLLLR